MTNVVKCNSTLHGVECLVWFLNFHTVTNHAILTIRLSVAFHPVSRGAKKTKDTRHFDTRKDDELDDLDGSQFCTLAALASRLPGDVLCTVPVMFPAMKTWPWAILAMVLAVTLLLATVLDAARTSSVREALSRYQPRGPASTKGIALVLAIGLTVIPSVMDAVQGDVRAVFRVLIFANLFLNCPPLWAAGRHATGTLP